MSNSRKTWISVIIAAVIVVGILAAAAVGGTAFFIYHHVQTQVTPSETAEERFHEARARFTGQQALLELRRDDDRPVVNRDALSGPPSTVKLEALRVLAYDRHENKLVNVSIPFWLLRLAPSNKFSFLNDNGIDFDSERIHLTLEDLERRGPGLILDQTDRRGSQVLVWTE